MSSFYSIRNLFSTVFTISAPPQQSGSTKSVEDMLGHARIRINKTGKAVAELPPRPCLCDHVWPAGLFLMSSGQEHAALSKDRKIHFIIFKKAYTFSKF